MGLTGDNKMYDGTTAATASGTTVLNGVIGGDDASVSGVPVFNFVSSAIGTNITVNTTGYTIAGAENGNYSLTQPVLSADITEVVLGVSDVSLRNVISLYPNPIKDVLHVKTSRVTIEKVTLFDLLGKTINRIELRNETIDFSRINTGIYFLRITTDKGTLVKRVIKK